MNPFICPRVLKHFDFADNTDFATYLAWAFKTVINKPDHFNLVEIMPYLPFDVPAR